MKVSNKRALLALAAACATGLASAQVYVGGEAGRTRIKDIDTATSTGAFVGYEINKHVAVEAAIGTLGRFEAVGGLRARVNTVQLSAVGFYPLNDQYKVYGRLGAGTTKVTGESGTTQHNLLVGIGAQYAVTPRIAIRSEYLRVASDTGQFKVGVAYRF